MSYILDALKKSEQERGHGNIPNVQTVHSSSLNYRTEKKSYWPYILIAAVLLNLLAIVYFIASKETPAEMPIVASSQSPSEPKNTAQKITVENPTQTETENVVTAKEIEEVKIEKKPVVIIANNNEATALKKPSANTIQPKKIQAVKKPVVIASKPKKTPINNQPKILEFYELPESIKQNLPAIIVSAHVYSTNPLQRSIVINNKFLEEGEYILDDLVLYEITTNGAIFDYEGTLFNYNVVSGWQ